MTDENRNGHQIDRLMYFFGLGYVKAQTTFERMKFTQQDLDDWERYGNENGRRWATHWLQRYKNPQDKAKADGKAQAAKRPSYDQPAQTVKTQPASQERVQEIMKKLPWKRKPGEVPF